MICVVLLSRNDSKINNVRPISSYVDVTEADILLKGPMIYVIQRACVLHQCQTSRVIPPFKQKSGFIHSNEGVALSDKAVGMSSYFLYNSFRQE